MYPHAIRLRGPWDFSFLDASPAASATTTIPGFWTAAQLAANRGPIELRRHFNWVARIEPTEIVWLSIDRCLGSASVSLNGRDVGAIRYSWGENRFDVTALLRPNNELTIRIEPETPALADEPAVGILEGVQLVVESNQFAVRELSWTTNWLDGLGDLSIHGVFAGDPAGSTYRVALDGAAVSSGVVEINSDGAWSTSLEGLTVDRWDHRAVGKPTLYSLDFSIHSEDEILYEQTSFVGFRHLERLGDQQWRINGSDLVAAAFPLSAATTYLPNFGEDQQTPFADWSLAAHSILALENHVAPTSLCKLCDRAGILILQHWTALAPEHPEDEPASRVLKHRLECHPSVVSG